VPADPRNSTFRPIAVALAAFLAAASLLPLVNWIPGGHEGRWYATARDGWVYGTLSAVLMAVVLAITWRRFALPWPDGLWARLGRRADAAPWRFSLGIGLVSLAAYAAVSTVILDRRPLLIDEIVQLFQARIFGQGRLWLPATGLPEFFGAMHLVDTGTRVYGQFPPGAPAMLVPGDLLGVPWLTVPLSAAVTAALWPVVLRTVEPAPGVRLGAALLFAFAPFTLFLSGSYMSHVTVLTWLVVALAALTRVVAPGDGRSRPWWAFLSGLGFGAAATVRPLDAFAFAVPAGAWFLWRALRKPRRWAEALPALAGVALPIAWMLWVNTATNGAPFRFGYDVLWGKAHGLGFHPAPWGADHTPERGVELVNLYLLRLQTYFLETPFPALLPLIGAVALALRAPLPLERVLLAGSGILVGCYWAYWHDGFYLGPRFLFPLTPVVALWTARFPGLVRARWGDGMVHRAVVITLVLGGLYAAASGIPVRGRQYANGLLTMRWDAEAAVRRAGLTDALVLVRESWGSQLAVRLWGLGLSRADGEKLYANVDACRLEEHVTALERTAIRGEAAKRLLWPLLADSAALEPSPYSQDHSERWQANLRYTPRCLRRVEDDRRGFTLYTPLLLARAPGVVFARDLHERTAVLLARYPGRTLWLLQPASDTVGAEPRLYPVSRDSLEAAWALEREPVSVTPAAPEP
jgi:hypothetical protein